MTPRTDDFRIEQDRASMLVTFTPTGARYRVNRTGPEGRGLAVEEVAPARDGSGAYAQADVQAMACRLVANALARGGA